MPQIHLPPRKSKADKGEEVRTTVASADGSLRKLGEKDLLLETGKGAILRFRLLGKTKFENKAGEAIRDSLLHLGDQISVQVNPDDPGPLRAGHALLPSLGAARPPRTL